MPVCLALPGRSRWPVRTPRARPWRGRTTRIFPWRRAFCPRSMRPHVAAVYAFARVADDIADEGTAPARNAAIAASRLAEPSSRGGRRESRRAPIRNARRSHCCRARTFDTIARSAGRAVRRSPERVRSGYHDDSVPLVARRARLLPAIGESGRPSRPADRRLPRRRTRSIVGCAVHGIAVDEFLAGLRTRLAVWSPVCAP